MASAHLHKGKWRAKWRDAAGVQRTKGGFKARSDAQGYAEQQERRERAGHQPFDYNVTWAEYKKRWLETRGVEATTAKADESRLNKWIDPKWGDQKLGAITKHAVEAWVIQLKKERIGGDTVRRIFYTFSNAMAKAVAEGVIPHSPCEGVHKLLPPADRPEIECYSMEDVAKIVDALHQPYSDIVRFLAYTGCRAGEVAALHWEDVDLAKRQITVRASWTRTGGLKGYPKGRTSRKVPLPAEVLEHLQRPDDWRTPCGMEHPGGWKCRSALVFRGPHGGPFDVRNMRRRHWLPTLRRLGLLPEGVEPGGDPETEDGWGTIHSLRHTYVSYLWRLGFNALAIGKVVGHTSVWVTERYSHLFNDGSIDAVRDAIDKDRPGIHSPIEGVDPGTPGYPGGTPSGTPSGTPDPDDQGPETPEAP